MYNKLLHHRLVRALLDANYTYVYNRHVLNPDYEPKIIEELPALEVIFDSDIYGIGRRVTIYMSGEIEAFPALEPLAFELELLANHAPYQSIRDIALQYLHACTEKR